MALENHWLYLSPQIDKLIQNGWPIGQFRHVAAEMAERLEWRYGQACFNLLHAIDSELATVVRFSTFDPFFESDPNSPVITKFYKEVFG